jgi:lysophospholipase L1-like esterase
MRSISFSLLLLSLLALLATSAGAARKDLPFRDGQRIVFLGDSITYAGGYVQYVDAFLATRFPERRLEILNLGLASETVSGLSEPDHPYPRPNVHTRLARVLQKTRPDWVVACYGMNDGIYYPWSAERFRKYQEGIRSLVDAVHAAGARIVVLTPAAFDPNPVRKVVQPRGAAKYSWMAPYEGYDEVLTRYAEWILAAHPGDGPAVDAHGALTHHLAVMRRAEPTYQVAGDGVHPNRSGEWVMASALLTALKVPSEVDAADLDAPTGRVRTGKVGDVVLRDGELSFKWESRVPMPFDPEWDRRLVAMEDLENRFNRYTLRVTGLKAKQYVLWEGEKRLGVVTPAQLAAGVNLLRFPELTTNQRSLQLLYAVRGRERVLSPAVLTDAGHERPDTPKGKPLPEARQEAGRLTRDIEALSRPVVLPLRLAPVP